MTRISASPTRSYRRTKLVILATFALYFAMIPLNSVFEEDHVEVFPFFSWRLFPNVPAWHTSQYALIIDSIEGQQLDKAYYLIPGSSVRHRKALRTIASACAKEIDCNETVAEILYPIIRQSIGEHSVDFSIVNAHIDLRDVQAGIAEVAAGRATLTDFFQPRLTVGEWNTETGRIDLSMEMRRRLRLDIPRESRH